jgi:hypothetical protein
LINNPALRSYDAKTVDSGDPDAGEESTSTSAANAVGGARH